MSNPQRTCADRAVFHFWSAHTAPAFLNVKQRQDFAKEAIVRSVGYMFGWWFDKPEAHTQIMQFYASPSR